MDLSENEEIISDSEDDTTECSFHVWRSPYYVPSANYAKKNHKQTKHPLQLKIKKTSTWIPPTSFQQNIRSRRDKSRSTKYTGYDSDSKDLSASVGRRPKEISLKSENSANQVVISAGEMNCPAESLNDVETSVQSDHKTSFQDWGKRLSYGISLFNIDNGELVWDYMEPGLFGTMRLRRNQCGVIEAFAEAEINNKSFTEEAITVINQQKHLRNLLNVSHHEWCALQETLGTGTWCLNHQALGKQPPVATLPTMDKLWHFLCKRRHYLPMLAVQMRRAGVKRLPMKILPKFIVTDIKTFNGDEIT